jgi:hypothetical protein
MSWILGNISSSQVSEDSFHGWHQTPDGQPKDAIVSTDLEESLLTSFSCTENNVRGIFEVNHVDSNEYHAYFMQIRWGEAYQWSSINKIAFIEWKKSIGILMIFPATTTEILILLLVKLI